MTQLITNYPSINYLFPNVANIEEGFYNINYKNPAQKREFIEKSLSLLMKVNHYMLSNKEAFFLVDPRACNDQCHLYALKAAQIKNRYADLTPEQQIEKNEENRFLHLSVFLSFCFQEKKLFKICVAKALAEMGGKLPIQRNRFNAFLMDPYLETLAKASLNQIFKDHVENTIRQMEPSDLSEELTKISAEDLFIDSKHVKKYGTLYTLPKLAGLALMIDTLAKENIPYVLKIKVLTKEGFGETILHPSRHIDASEKSVMVFEGFATPDGTSLDECKNSAQNCPHYFYQRTDNRNLLHDSAATCFFAGRRTFHWTVLKQKSTLPCKIRQSRSTRWAPISSAIINPISKNISSTNRSIHF